MKRDNSYLINNKFAKGSNPNKTAFKKGSIPWNKGIKGIHLSKDTEFKKGMKSLRWKPIGTKALRKYGKINKRLFIKINEPNIWIDYAKFVWIKNNGNIPKGFVLHHIDKNPLNNNIENLVLLTRSGHSYIHDLQKIGRNSRKYKENSQLKLL